ncbi:MAG: hypothetical protein Q9227_006938 [Pyrenula ochraceoflavens]
MATTDLPMPPPTVPLKPLLSFKILTFDIYGTLIDWETSIVDLLQPLLSHLSSENPLKSNSRACAAAFNDIEHTLQIENPSKRYDLLLEEGYKRFARQTAALGPTDLSDEDLTQQAKAFGQNVEHWQPFPDTIDAMQRLAKYYKLAPLSNVDNASFSRTLAGPLKGVHFDAIYTAEDIGSYKPDLRNFNYLVEHVKSDFGIEKDEILQTAQSLLHDHSPAKKMGLSSAWIARKGAGMGGEENILHERGDVGYGWRFSTLGQMADAVEEEARKAGKLK